MAWETEALLTYLSSLRVEGDESRSRLERRRKKRRICRFRQKEDDKIIKQNKRRIYLQQQKLVENNRIFIPILMVMCLSNNSFQ